MEKTPERALCQESVLIKTFFRYGVLRDIEIASMQGPLAPFVNQFIGTVFYVALAAVIIGAVLGFLFKLTQKSLSNRLRRGGRNGGGGNHPLGRRERNPQLESNAVRNKRDASGGPGAAAERKRITSADIASLEWLAFEKLCLIWLRALGCNAERTPKRHGSGADEGIDIAGTTRDGQAFCAQCKAHAGLVGVKFVREFFGSFASSNQRGVFFSSSGFTDDARRFAAKEGIVLVGNSDLNDVLNEPKTLALARSTIFDGYEATPSCPHCERKMVLRTGRTQFWGCVNYPRCRQKLNVRAAIEHSAERCRVPGDWLEAAAAPVKLPDKSLVTVREPDDDTRFAPPDDASARNG